MSGKPPTNEEVIDELTKGLENSCVSRCINEEEKENDDDEECFYDARLSVDDEGHKDEAPATLAKAAGSKIGPSAARTPLDADEYLVDEAILEARQSKFTAEELEASRQKAAELKATGNRLFQEGEYKEATLTYTKALQLCPLTCQKDRAVLYANRAASKAQFMPKKLSAIDDCSKAIELDLKYVKAILRRARYYEDEEKLDEALEDLKKVQEINPMEPEVLKNIPRLNTLIQERNEKLKDEMLGKLKDLGNLFLKPFGLSTNNFQMQKDEAGGYSVKINQNTS